MSVALQWFSDYINDLTMVSSRAAAESSSEQLDLFFHPALKMFKVALLLFALSMIQISQGMDTMEESRVVKRGSTIRVCGKKLVQALNLFCNGEYYDPSEESNVQERNIPFQMEDPFRNWLAVTLSSGYPNEAGSETISEQVPTSHLFKRFGQVGIVDECCRKACSPSVLLTYCRN